MSRRILHGLPVLGVAAAVVLAHLRAVAGAPLVRYGFRGAEYLEHIQRQMAIDLTGGLSWEARLRELPDHLALLDGQYPALLHVLAAAWGRLAGDGIVPAVHLNLVFLTVLAGGTAWLGLELARLGAAREEAAREEAAREATDWGGPAWGAFPGGAAPGTLARTTGAMSPPSATPPPAISAPAIAAMTVLLVPAIFATARRYYYDLPLAAWCVLATAALLATARARWAPAIAALATAAACLTKWQAGLYLAPAWVWAAVATFGGSMRERRSPFLRVALRVVLPALGVVLLCWPVVRRSDRLGALAAGILGEAAAHGLGLASLGRHGSLDDALGQGATAVAEGGVLVRLAFYADGLVGSSLGSMLAVALLLCAIAGARGWRALVVGGVLIGPGLLVLATRVRVMDERFLLPMLPIGVAAVAAALEAGRRPRAARLLAGCLLAAGGVQLLAIDGVLQAAWAPRSTVAGRGWNRRGELPVSPWQSYLEAAEKACAGVPPPSIRISSLLQWSDNDLHAWRWAFMRACPGIEVEAAGRAPEGVAGIQLQPGTGVAASAAASGDAVLTAAPLKRASMRLVGRVEIPGGRPARVWVYRAPPGGR